MIKVDKKQKRCPETGQSEGIPSNMSDQKKRNFDFVKMKSFLKNQTFNNQSFKSEFLEVA